MNTFITHTEDLFHWTDILIIGLFLIIFILISIFIRGAKIEKKSEYKYHLRALLIKLAGGLAFGLIYLFYYKTGGDTFYYFGGARTLAKIFLDNPYEYFKLIFSSHEFSSDLIYIKSQIYYARSLEEWFMVKLLSPISLFSFNRFLVAQFLMSFVVFFGSWRFFQSFLLFFPHKKKEAFYSVFLIPSIILWSGGLLKDSVTFSFLGIFFYYSIRVFFLKEFKLKFLFFIVLSVYIIFNVKAYIILSFIPVLIIGLVSHNISLVKSSFLRMIVTPILIVITLPVGFFIVNNLQNASEKYALENLQSRAEGFHSWHTTLGGSTYDLGATDYTAIGIISKIPAAVYVTYFRPDPTEVTSMATAIAAIEALVFLFLFVLLLIRYRFKWIVIASKNPFLLMGLIYVIIFGFIVGFTSYNFGALSRYKIPAMPFFSFFLLYFDSKYKNEKLD